MTNAEKNVIIYSDTYKGAEVFAMTKNIIGFLIVALAFACNFLIPAVYKKRNADYSGSVVIKIKLSALAFAVVGMLIVFA